MSTARQARPPIERLLGRVKIDPHGCWIWTGGTARGGYGAMTVGSQTSGTRARKMTHRLSWEHFRGPIPDGLEIDHLCRVRLCCNPDHLEPVTSSENSLRGNGCCVRIVCPEGHLILGSNVAYARNKSGKVQRQCRVCKLERLKRYRRKATR